MCAQADLHSELNHNCTQALEPRSKFSHSLTINIDRVLTEKLRKDHLSFCRQIATLAAFLSAW